MKNFGCSFFKCFFSNHFYTPSHLFQPMTRFSESASTFKESIIREMTRLSAEHEAINLSQESPELPTPKVLVQSAMESLRKGHNHYTTPWGAPELREGLASYVSKDLKLQYEPEYEITVTSGVNEGLMASVLGLCRAKKDIVVFEPFYESYIPAITFAGCQPKLVRIKSDMSLDQEALKEAFGKNTEAVILNSPHNPTGKVFSKQDLKLISDLCNDNDAIAISDETYSDITFDSNSHRSIAAVGDMRERTVVLRGLSRTFNATGWRIGYALAPVGLSEGLRRVHEVLTVCAPAPFQQTMLEALDMDPMFYRTISSHYQHIRDILYDGLKKAGLSPWRSQGTYYMLADYSKWADNFNDDGVFARWFTEDQGVAGVPGSSFFLHNKKTKLIRFSFCKSENVITEAVERIKQKMEKV
jgi:L-glutamine---4-(methylsulfanyl)-2-oxobutanoate aminotransferase